MPTDHVDIPQDASAVTASYDRGPAISFLFAATAGARWVVTKGQTEPLIRGWQSIGEADTPTPIPVLRLLSDQTPGPITCVVLLNVKSPDQLGAPLLPLTIGSDGMSINIGPEGNRHRINIRGDEAVTELDYQPPAGLPVVSQLTVTRMNGISKG